MDQAKLGLYLKYRVEGIRGAGFVLDLVHDKFAPPGLAPNEESNGWTVTRTDLRHRPGEKHDRCRYYIIAIPPEAQGDSKLLSTQARRLLADYAARCRNEYPALAADLVDYLEGRAGWLR